MRHLQHATLKRALSGRSLGIVSSRLPEALLLSAVLWLGLTSAGSSSCSSMPCRASFLISAGKSVTAMPEVFQRQSTMRCVGLFA